MSMALSLRRAGVACTVVLGLLVGPRVAAAQQGDPAAAEALFREGRASFDAGDFGTACKKFRESNRLGPAIGTVFNMAACEEKLGHIATAWTLYREVTQRLPATDERTAMASARAAALEPRLPKLSLRLGPDAPEQTKVYRDGVELQAGSLDSALPIDPGKHVIAVEAPGHERTEFVVVLSDGESKMETVRPGKPADRPDAQSSGSSTRRTLGFVVGGVGVVGLGVGAVTGLLVLGKKGVVDDNCDAAKRCNQQGLDAADAGSTLGPISGVSLVAGALALGAGVALVLSSGGSSERSAATTSLVLSPRGLSAVHRF